VKQGPLRILGALVLTAACASLGASAALAQAKSVTGKVTGVVRDAGGTPQMGASVELIAEAAGANLSPLNFLTNTQGVFRGDKLIPGLYSVRVTLAGFLPTLQQHVRINANVTTLVRVEMESLFASLDQLRRQPAAKAGDADDWKWVLRSASGMRPVLQWDEHGVLLASEARREAGSSSPKMLLEFTDGARRPGSVSNIASAPGTAFAYDQKLGGTGHLLVAGQMSYQDSAAGGVATVWLPTGTLGAGPHTALVLREAKLGNTGLTFRGVRLDQGGAAALGDRVLIRYGAEYMLVGLGSGAAALRPRISAEARITDAWKAAMIFASEPGSPNMMEAGSGDLASALNAAMGELDAFPALMWRNGRPVLQGGWHEEISAERTLGEKGKLQFAGFHDDNRHIAVFGQGRDLPVADYFQDSYSNGFAYDGGSASSWGARVALREKLTDDLEWTTVYAFGGVLAPTDEVSGQLRDSLRNASRNSIGTNVSWTSQRSHTKVSASYKWINGPALSRLDNFGETLYGMNPFMHISVRQQLPRFGLGHWEAIADCDNLMAQGYVPMTTRDGQAILVPAFRTVRGGLSVQF
jgi:hypothetical protein